MDKYIVIYPSGELRCVEIPKAGRLHRMYEIIDCSCVEQVRTVFSDICLVVDESGKVKDPPQAHNELASCLYYGFLVGADDIVGPAILVGLHRVGPYHELDWCPLTDKQLDLLSVVFDRDVKALFK